MASPRARRRKITNVVALATATAATGFGLIWLVWILATTVINGFSALNLKLVTQMTPPPGSDGGLLNAIYGSAVMILVAVLLGAPIGILAGTYLAEYGKRSALAEVVRFVNDILLSAPSIVIGLFVYELVVQPSGHFSGWAGAIALAFILLPVVVRTTDETLRLVPITLREAALALGAPQWKMIVRVLYPAARTGILTGLLLGIARISGETAPLLFTALNNQYFTANLGGADGQYPRRDLPIRASAVRRLARPGLGRSAPDDDVRPGRQCRRSIPAAFSYQLKFTMPRTNGGTMLGDAARSTQAADRGESALPAGRISVEDLDFFYGANRALKGISLNFPERRVTGMIGPSGCGKSTLLRVLNRMYDLYPGQRATGKVMMDSVNIINSDIDRNELRSRIGMVFQKPTPFPMSIYNNIAFGVRLHEGLSKSAMDDRVEWSLTRAALWSEAKDRLDASAMGLSGGQQQRLCIARTIATKPEVILLDEPTSALDPISTLKVEELIDELKTDFTIAIVTHNMQQAARCADQVAFFYLGEMVEVGPATQIFTSPREKRTQEYITGRFG